jgi:hypothetical protein
VNEAGEPRPVCDEPGDAEAEFVRPLGVELEQQRADEAIQHTRGD